MDSTISDASKQMDKALNILHEDFTGIRAGRASSSLVDNLSVSVYGGTTELTIAQLGTTSLSDPQTITFTPFDVSIISEIEKEINKQNRGFTVYVDGSVIRIKLPPLTEERRQEFIKLAKTKAENIKVMIRQARHDAINQVRDKLDAKEIAEDEKFRLEKEIQKITDEKTDEIEKILERKVEELKKV